MTSSSAVALLPTTAAVASAPGAAPAAGGRRPEALVDLMEFRGQRAQAIQRRLFLDRLAGSAISISARAFSCAGTLASSSVSAAPPG